MRQLALYSAIVAASTLTACSSSSSSNPAPAPAPVAQFECGDADASAIANSYSFNSFLADTQGQNSVSYCGQTSRHILINDLKSYLGNKPTPTTAAGVIDEVLTNFVYRNDASETDISRDKAPSEAVGEAITFSVKGSLTPLQTNYAGDKNLVAKLAGQDKEEHLNYAFAGWDDAGVTAAVAGDKPLAALFAMLNDYAATAVRTTDLTVPGPTADITGISEAYIDANGLDYQQLIQKYLLMSVTFSQGTADYLKSGFGADDYNSTPGGTGKAYTNAEHKWDEAFGYLGAARNMLDFTDAELRAQSGRADYQNGYFDINSDGKVDINAELNLGQAVNCAKRDLGATAQATDYTTEVFEAFYNGRKLINDAAADLTPAQVTELEGYALTAANTWEKCIAATVVHYINDVQSDLDYTDADGFKDLAKHWAEMKGFALGLQFNPESPLSEADYIDLHDKMGMAPVLADGSQGGVAPTGTAAAAIAAYKVALDEARDILADAYGAEFAANKNVW